MRSTSIGFAQQPAMVSQPDAQVLMQHAEGSPHMKIVSFEYRKDSAGLAVFVECSAADALRILTMLQSADAPHAPAKPLPASDAAPPKAQATQPQSVAAAPVPAPTPTLQPKVDEQAIARIAASNPKPEPKPEKPKTERKTKAEEPALQGALIAPPSEAVEVPQADPPKATAVEVTPSPMTRTESQTPGDLPDAIRNATRIRDVLSHFVRQGAKTFEEAWPKLRAVQSQIPALANNAALEDRARRAWEVMDLADL